MKLIDKWNESRRLKVLAAALLNAVVLAFIVLIVNVGFESNDDRTLAAFVDGQMAESTAYIPYINILLGFLLKGIYALFGQGAAWYTILQYALLLISFSAVSFVLFERLRFWQGALVSIVMLLFFGVDAYTIISYTKTAGVCTVGGMLLITHAMDGMEKGRRKLPVILGAALCLFGFMLRPMEFLPCFGLMAVLSLRWFYGLLFEEKGSVKEKLRRFGVYAAPFAAVLVICAGLYSVNELAWSKEPWAEYHEYDALRVDCVDYGRPAYEDMAEGYKALGLTQNAVELFGGSNYFDTQVFDGEFMAGLTRLRDENFPALSLGECLGKFLDDCLLGFFVNLHVYGFLIVLALWLCAGGHKLRDWLSLAGVAGIFALLYLYLIYRGRYMIDRVDMALFFAMTASLAYMLRTEKLQREKCLAAMLLVFAIGVSYYLNRDVYRSNVDYLDHDDRAAVELLLEDEEHLFLSKVDAVSDRIYSPLEPAAGGYWDRIVLLGGWTIQHPNIMSTLEKYGVENPYRDIVNNERVYVIDDDIELTLSFIHEYYDEDATAQPVEPLSSETGLNIYRILD